MESLAGWATTQMMRILPLPEEDAKQIIDYSMSLDANSAAAHLENLLGESPQAFEFISSFNSRREAAVRAERSAAKPASKPAHRQLRAEPLKSGKKTSDRKGQSFQLSSTSDAMQISAKTPPSAAGPLISDLKGKRSSSSSRSPSRQGNGTINAATKVNITGGTSMRGDVSSINDLDQAIRTLEIATNPSASRKACDCNATRHPLLTSAPNCLRCGKIICVREGFGPCTFCDQPLLSSDDIQSMISSLREERGREKMEANNASARRRPQQGNGTSAALASAQEHRDKLLGFQETSARRTRIHDEAADFETPASGLSQWASPHERALALKRQQQNLREQEYNARPEYEKRRTVVSLDVVGGKVIKKFGQAEANARSSESEDEDTDVHESPSVATQQPGSSLGAFSNNPLLGKMVKPTYHPPNGKDAEQLDERESGRRKKPWRRVQDDLEDNEELILKSGL